MEVVKTSRGNGFLTFAVLVNILFSAVSIGFLIYKVRVLEEHVLQLQKGQRYHTEAIRENERADLTHRNKRAVESFGTSKSCSSCHNACVHLFGLGASAKVLLCTFLAKRKVAWLAFPTIVGNISDTELLAQNSVNYRVNFPNLTNFAFEKKNSLTRELRLFHGIHVVKRFSATQIDSCFYDHRVLHPSKVLKLIDSYVLLRIFFLSYL